MKMVQTSASLYRPVRLTRLNNFNTLQSKIGFTGAIVKAERFTVSGQTVKSSRRCTGLTLILKSVEQMRDAGRSVSPLTLLVG